MSYNSIWIQNNHSSTGWIDRRQASKMNKSNEFQLTYNRLYTAGNYVVLVSGTNYCFDELFLLETAPLAQHFNDTDFRSWESFQDEDDEGCGFEEVSLYAGGSRIATKSCAPSKRIEVSHE